MGRADGGGRGGRALLIVDMLSDYRFPGGEELARRAADAIPAIRETRDRADALGIPVVYANDIIDDWRCSPAEAVARALRADAMPAELVRRVAPRPGDAFMHKGRHSAFHGTPLAQFLDVEGIAEIVLAGQVTEQCILYTALDAHVRRHDLTVITDAVVPLDPELGAAALRMMGENMGADVVPLAGWAAAAAA